MLTPDALYAKSLDCIHCGLCLSVCPTYDVLGREADSPRGRIYLMRALAEGRIDDAAVRAPLQRCLDCRACEPACPSGVRYGELLEGTRHRLAERAPDRSVSARLRAFALAHVVARPRRLRLAFALLRAAQVLHFDDLAAALRLLPRGAALLRPRIPPARDRRALRGVFLPAGTPRGRVALFTGCVMPHLFGAVHRATVRTLVAHGFAVEVPRGQACCGALLVHNGQAAAAQALAARNVAAFANADVIVNNSAGCGAALKEYGTWLGSTDATAFAARCRDVCEFLAERGLAATPSPFPHKVAYDDPCHLCHAQGVREPPRALLRQVPGLELVAHDDPERCCGSAGIYNLVETEIAETLGRSKARAIAASGARVVATGNPGCMMQLRAHLRVLGADIDVVHPIELLAPREPMPSPP